MSRKEINELLKEYGFRFGNSKMVECKIPRNSERKSKPFNPLYGEMKKAVKLEFGEDSLAYKKIFEGAEDKGYNFLFTIFAQDKIFGNGEQICLVDDIYEVFDGTEVIHPQLILYGREIIGKGYKSFLNPLIQSLNGCDFDCKNPLLITNPVLKKDSNKDGFSIGIGPNTIIENDERFSINKFRIELRNGLEKFLLPKGIGASKICSSNYEIFACNNLLDSSYAENKIVILNSKDSKIL